MSLKLSEEDENPIDNLLYKIVEVLDPIFYKLNFTPNMITTLSLITGLISGYFYYKNSLLCIPFYIISYLLDGSDGYFARKHNMTSEFGDYYDHISDIVKGIIIVQLIYLKSKKYKLIIILIIWILSLLMYYHLSLQELVYDKQDKSYALNILNKYIKLNKDNIRWSRYFGCGTFNLVIVIIMYLSINGKI